MDDELPHIQKADAVATDEKMPLWSMNVCKAFRVAPLLIQRDGCDMLKINPPFFDADGKGFRMSQKPMRLHLLSDG
jgi:hypothetical protein